YEHHGAGVQGDARRSGRGTGKRNAAAGRRAEDSAGRSGARACRNDEAFRSARKNCARALACGGACLQARRKAICIRARLKSRPDAIRNRFMRRLLAASLTCCDPARYSLNASTGGYLQFLQSGASDSTCAIPLVCLAQPQSQIKEKKKVLSR